MKLVISDRDKANKFTTIFHHFNTFTEHLQLMFLADKLYVQAMDTSHVCLIELSLDKTWFDKYEINSGDKSTIAISTMFFYKIVNTKQENQSIELSFEGDPDKLNIEFTSNVKGEYKKLFKLSLIELDCDTLNVPSTDYTAELVIGTKILNNMSDQLAIFDEVVNIVCTEEKIEFTAEGTEGQMMVPLHIDELEEYAIEEDGRVDISFSLAYFHKMCLFHKIADEVKLEFSEDYPVKMTYSLNEESHLSFWLAPKIAED